MEIGKYNTLTVARLVDFGAYLTDGQGNDVLLPAKYITTPLHPDDKLEVFVYTDGDDRPIATTLRPHATVGQVAWLTVAQVNDIGAFMEWGIDKDLLVPFREQQQRMRPGGRYGVYVYLDHASGRVAATARLEKYIGQLLPEYPPFAEVDAQVVARTPLGYRVVVDHLHWGLIYDSELYGRELRPGQHMRAWVRKVRDDDGKIDLTLHAPARERATLIGDRILARMRMAGGRLDLDDHSSPDLVNASLGCSKKDFKKALGHLLKEQMIYKSESGYAISDKKD